MTQKEAISKYAGIIQEEFLRQVDLIKCDNKELFSWIIYKIKEKLLTSSPTMSDSDGWMTGYDILIDREMDVDNEENPDFSIMSNYRDVIFKEAEQLIEKEIDQWYKKIKNYY